MKSLRRASLQSTAGLELGGKWSRDQRARLPDRQTLLKLPGLACGDCKVRKSAVKRENLRKS